LYKDVARKTEALVRERVRSYGLTTTLALVTIDEKTVEALKKDGPASSTKVLNLAKSLVQAVGGDADRQPYLVPIGERAEAILEAYDDRQISTQVALQQLEKLLGEFVQARKEQEQTGFDINTFTIYWVLKQAGSPEADTIAPGLNEAFGRFPNHAHNAGERRELKAALYKILLPAVGKDRMVGVADWLLGHHRK
jgi:type I restriction enzyme R subunit